MAIKLVMGNEAIALGAIHAGVNLVSGYPGNPSTEVLETVAKQNPGDIYVEWSVNEKAALEVAAGASYTGARSMVTMKQVGLNVASDPLMSLAYIGVKGGMVILVADDPGPISSQTEQDTRHFAKYANLPVFDPTTPEEAYEMIEEAFDFSETYQIPVIFRPTTRICHGCATVDIREGRRIQSREGFVKDPKWTIFPKLSYENHLKIEALSRKLSKVFSTYERNAVEGSGDQVIVASGVAYTYAKEALASLQASCRLVKLATANPFPKDFARSFLQGASQVLVLEELDPVIEEELTRLCGEDRIPLTIFGKHTGHAPYAGEYSTEALLEIISSFLSVPYERPSLPPPPALPVRPPVLCAGCPHRASFYAVKQAMKGQDAVFTGDIGCYTLGNAKPLDMVDTCLCMGAGITIAQGLSRMEPDKKQIAFIGDSTFFHTGIAGILNAAYNETDITVVILDNSTTAMTGHQPHPGTGQTMMGDISEKIDIEALVKACGVKCVKTANPLNLKEAVAAVQEAVAFSGVSAVIFRSPCIALFKPAVKMEIQDSCINCKKCIREIGCPAIMADGGKVRIEPSLCYGCGLCSQICPVHAISGGDSK